MTTNHINGESYQVGSVLQGTGLTNAGRHYTIKHIGRIAGRVCLVEHLTERTFWTYIRHYRLMDY